MNARETDDFASAAMMRLVAAGLARQGIAAGLRAPGGAHVPRPDKQAALAAIMASKSSQLWSQHMSASS